ncbi:CHAD domain [Rothia kristinae]|nr:CHAD domain [Rothia kristinae]
MAELAGPVLADLRILDVAVRAGVEDSVHQMRIRLRTMRSILRALRGGLDPSSTRPSRRG